MLAFGATRPHAPIEWSYYLLYFVLGWRLKSFLLGQIPEAVVDLREGSSLPEQTYPRLVRDLEDQLNHRFWIAAYGLAGGLLIAAFYWPAPLDCVRQLSWLCGIVMPVDVLYGYVVGVAAWKAWAMGRQVRAWGARGDLTIRPFHPDGCAGLAAIGRLFLSLFIILALGGIFCAGWLLLAGWGPQWIKEGIDSFVPWLGGGFIVVLAVGIVAFMAPMLTVHRLMAERARSARAERASLAVAIAELEGSLVPQGTALTPEHAEPQLRQLRALRDVYSERERIPTWPVDLRTLSAFAVGVTVQAIGLVSSAAGLAEKLKPWLKSWFG